MNALWNTTKTAVLMAGLMGLAMGVGYALGGPRAMLPAFLIGGMMNVAAFFFSDKIALASVGAREIGREEDPELWNAVADLARRADMPMPRVYISPQPAPNAFATGRSPSHSAVCVTQGLRQLLNEQELAGVIAHELSHIRHRDVLIGTIAAVVAGAISYAAYMAMWVGRGRDNENRNPIVGLLIVILAPIAAMLIQMAISRSREYEADRLGATLAGSPRGLARALEKLARGSSQIPLPVMDSQRHMFIVAPLTGTTMAGLFMTHPPIEERVKRLLAMERQSGL